MKKLTLISVILFAANMLFGQYKIDTSFYSVALGEEKMVDVYFPPGYNENPSWCYPVIYYLHGYGGDQNTMGTMIAWLTSYINNGIIDPVIMVGADNSPDPLGGSGYVNSILWGNYEDYMVNDLVEWIDNSFRTIPERKGRALLGQSMGGYGAFRYGILHKDKFSVLASHAGVVNLHDAYLREQMQQAVIAESVPGPPYYYNFFGTGINTKLCFLACAMTAPDTNSPQTYINPPIVEFFMDENGDYIDTVLAKQEPYDIIFLINSLSASDSVGIFFGCGENDNFFFYPGHLALKDTMDLLGIPYEFYSHSGDHTMPGGFKDRALTFIDSLLMPPILLPTSCLLEGITFTTQEQIDNFQTNYPECTEIEGDVHIDGESISNLSGLNVLTSIGGFLAIINTNLPNLEGLENLIFVGGDLRIGIAFNGWGVPNPILADISALQNLTSIGQNLRMGSNPVLSDCDVQSICAYLADPVGEIEIHDNAPGCNSPEEVEEACLNSVKDNYSEIEISISPNPVSDVAVLSLNISNCEPVKVSIYNLTGICQKSWEFNNQPSGTKEIFMDLSEIPAGVYFCRVHAGNEVATRKILKL
jgi:S-formylglutathione hydrolase FrmB